MTENISLINPEDDVLLQILFDLRGEVYRGELKSLKLSSENENGDTINIEVF